jgi:hypothetical protein
MTAKFIVLTITPFIYVLIIVAFNPVVNTGFSAPIGPQALWAGGRVQWFTCMPEVDKPLDAPHRTHVGDCLGNKR